MPSPPPPPQTIVGGANHLNASSSNTVTGQANSFLNSSSSNTVTGSYSKFNVRADGSSPGWRSATCWRRAHARPCASQHAASNTITGSQECAAVRGEEGRQSPKPHCSCLVGPPPLTLQLAPAARSSTCSPSLTRDPTRSSCERRRRLRVAGRLRGPQTQTFIRSLSCPSDNCPLLAALLCCHASTLHWLAQKRVNEDEEESGGRHRSDFLVGQVACRATTTSNTGRSAEPSQL